MKVKWIGAVTAAILSSVLLCGRTCASELQQQAEQFGTQSVLDAVPPEAEELLEGLSPNVQSNFVESIGRVLEQTLLQGLYLLRDMLKTVFRILIVVMLCQLLESFCDERGKRAALVTCVLALTTLCGSEVTALAGLGRQTMSKLSDFSSALIPVMAAAAAAAGSPTAAGSISAAAVFFSSLLVRFCDRILIPAVYAFLALSAGDCILQENRLKKLRQLLGGGIERCLKVVAYLFTGFLGVTGILAGSADAAAVKAAKSAFSAAVPVVGGIISDAAQSLLSSASMLKASIGTFGMLTVLAIFSMPAIQMGVSYLSLKMTTALCGLLGSRLQDLLEASASAMGYVLAMIASCALICLLTCCCMMKAVQP